MTNPPFSSTWRDIFENVYPKISSKNTGVLYRVLNIILEGEEFQAKNLCDYFGIDQSSSLEEDKKFSDDFLEDITNLIFAEKTKIQALNKLITSSQTKVNDTLDHVNLLESNQSKEKRKMYWIIVVACLMVGAFACLKYLEKTRSRKTNSLSLKASLCLALPASAVYKLRKEDSIGRDEILRLIDSATEFLCVEESKNIPVEITNEEPSSESQLKFYVRINLKNGGNIIGKETQYGMQRELPLNVIGEITELGFLKNVSILRSFNRI